MKNIIFVTIILCASLKAYAQDYTIENRKLILENDSLQKRVKMLELDSIVKLNKVNTDLSSNIIKLYDTGEILKKDLEKLKKELESEQNSINKNKIKIENDNLIQKRDSLILKNNELNLNLTSKEQEIIKQKQVCEVNLKKEKETGKNEIIDKIVKTYTKPFDEIIQFSTLKSLERDLQIIGPNSAATQKVQELKKYYLAELVLKEKFNEQKITNEVTNLKSIEQTELVKKMIERLSDYVYSNDGLKEVIKKIIEIDKKKSANNIDNIQKLKLQEILAELADYFRNYHFNFTDYPYLSEIVLEIMKQKQKNADFDISSFLNKL